MQIYYYIPQMRVIAALSGHRALFNTGLQRCLRSSPLPAQRSMLELKVREKKDYLQVVPLFPYKGGATEWGLAERVFAPRGGVLF